MPNLGVVLCDGLGVEMASRVPTALHKIAGEPLFLYPLRAVLALGDIDSVVAVGSLSESEAETIGDYLPPKVGFVRQEEGENEAAAIARVLDSAPFDHVLIVEGDRPLLTAATLKELLKVHFERPCQASVALVSEGSTSPSAGNGNAITPSATTPAAATAGVYMLATAWLKDLLDSIDREDLAYLGIGSVIGSSGGLESSCSIFVDKEECLKVRNRIDLAHATALMRKRINRSLVSRGVQLVDPDKTYVDSGVSIEADTVVRPGCVIEGESRIGRGCIIGPNAIVRSSIIGDRCLIGAAVIEDSIVGHDSRIDTGVHVTANSRLPPGSDLHQ